MKKFIIISIIATFFLGCNIVDNRRPEEVYSTGNYYTQTANVEFVVVYSDGSNDTIVETITNTKTPMQGLFYHNIEIDGIEFIGIEVDFEDYRLIGLWDNTVDNITFSENGTYVSTNFGSGNWDTVLREGIYLDNAGPYYYGFNYDITDEYITIDSTVDLKKM